MAGRYEDARRDARLSIESADPKDLSAAWVVAAAVEIFAGEVARGSEYLTLADKHLRADPSSEEISLLSAVRDLRDIGAGVGRNEGPLRTQLFADGGNLVDTLRPNTAYESGSELVLRVEARRFVTTHGEISGWLRAGPPVDAGLSPEYQLTHWTTLSEMAFALGQNALGAELRDRARRFHAALLRRDVALLLAVLEQL